MCLTEELARPMRVLHTRDFLLQALTLHAPTGSELKADLNASIQLRRSVPCGCPFGMRTQQCARNQERERRHQLVQRRERYRQEL